MKLITNLLRIYPFEDHRNIFRYKTVLKRTLSWSHKHRITVKNQQNYEKIENRRFIKSFY